MENKKTSFHTSTSPIAGCLLVLAAIVLFALSCGMKFISVGFIGLSMPEFISVFGGSESMWYWVFWGLTLFLWFLALFLRDRLFMIYGCFVGLVYIAMCVIAFGSKDLLSPGAGFICMIVGLAAECIATLIMPQKDDQQQKENQQLKEDVLEKG